MLEENKNLKVTSNMSAQYETDTSISDGQTSHSLSYNKTNKLITALYMVTDIMDKEEPLRNKLRSLGSEIISDTCTASIHSETFKKTTGKIIEILSFLDIASAVGMISEMNCNILKKEFTQLKQSLQENHEQGLSLSELFKDTSPVLSPAKDETKFSGVESLNTPKEVFSVKNKMNNIGVQKGSTLLKALSRVQVSDRVSSPLKNKIVRPIGENDFDVLKKKRREEILKIIKENKDTHPSSGGATISDIKSKAKGVLTSCGEKTLQRELVSMVKDNVLKKTGEKRWSKYFL